MLETIAEAATASEPSGDPPITGGRRAEPCGRSRAGAVVRCLARMGCGLNWAEVTDLSADAVGLVLERGPDLGRPLLVQFSRRGRQGAVARVARVAHAAPLPVWGWAVGCRFDKPLSREDLVTAREATGLREQEPRTAVGVPALRELHDRLRDEGVGADPARVAAALLGVARDKAPAGDDSPLAAWLQQLALEVRHAGTPPDASPPPEPVPRRPVAGLLPIHAGTLPVAVT